MLRSTFSQVRATECALCLALLVLIAAAPGHANPARLFLLNDVQTLNPTFVAGVSILELHVFVRSFDEIQGVRFSLPPDARFAWIDSAPSPFVRVGQSAEFRFDACRSGDFEVATLRVLFLGSLEPNGCVEYTPAAYGDPTNTGVEFLGCDDQWVQGFAESAFVSGRPWGVYDRQPANGATGISTAADFRWTEQMCGYCIVDLYDYPIWVSTNPENLISPENVVYGRPDLEPYTTYYWTMQPYWGCSSIPEPWVFTTGGPTAVTSSPWAGVKQMYR